MSGISQLIIKAYSDEKFSSQKGEFTAAVNPEDLKITSGVDYHMSQGMGTSGAALKYHASLPRVLAFKLFFDNTGAIPGMKQDVEEQLDKLQKVIYDFQDNISSPYYIRVIWGTIDFQGRLIKLETSYTMFQPNGTPVRAQAIIEIAEYIDHGSRAAGKDLQVARSKAGKTTVGASVAGGAAGVGGAALVEAGGGPVVEQAGTEIEETPVSNMEEVQEHQGTEVGQDEAASEVGEEAVEDEVGEEPNEEEMLEEEAETAVHEVKEGDTVPGVANEKLGDPNMAKGLAKYNGLDSLRGLVPGLALAIPSLGLLALLMALTKKGLQYAKKKGSAAKQKVKQHLHHK